MDVTFHYLYSCLSLQEKYFWCYYRVTYIYYGAKLQKTYEYSHRFIVNLVSL